MPDRLDCGAVTGWRLREAPESEGVHGQGYGVGEKSWKRTEVVPPVSSLSHQLLGDTKAPAGRSVSFRHLLCPRGTYCPHWAPVSWASQCPAPLPFQMVLIKSHQHLIKYTRFGT